MDDFWIKYKSYNRSNIDSAREMRKTPTPAEEKMWQEVLRHRPWWYKFTRQKPIWSFILDFYCAKLWLAIELDGEGHKKNREYDKQRTSFLSSKWILVIRYRNNDIIKNIDNAYKELLDYIKEIENT